MAIDKAKKDELVSGYAEMLSRSQAVIFADFSAMPMPLLNTLRKNVREAGGGLHAAKNTLIGIALRNAGMAVPEDLLVGSTIAGFCYGDVSAIAKAMLDFARENGEKFTIKGGVMGATPLSADDVKALATLPPLNILRGQILGLLQAPATRIASVLAAPGRQVATVLKAYAYKAGAGEPAKEEAPAEAPAAAA